jgi:hypothetical protein
MGGARSGSLPGFGTTRFWDGVSGFRWEGVPVAFVASYTCPMTARELYEREIATNPRFKLAPLPGEGVVIVGALTPAASSLRSRR